MQVQTDAIWLSSSNFHTVFVTVCNATSSASHAIISAWNPKQIYLDGLNDKQLEAVTLPHQSALILAGAGSGKTRVLTTRIAWLIQTEQISPMGLMAVTFTNKAAKEMLTRLTAMLPINTRGMWAGTFHGLCNRLTARALSRSWLAFAHSKF